MPQNENDRKQIKEKATKSNWNTKRQTVKCQFSRDFDSFQGKTRKRIGQWSVL